MTRYFPRSIASGVPVAFASSGTISEGALVTYDGRTGIWDQRVTNRAAWDVLGAENDRRTATQSAWSVNISDLAAFENWPAYIPHGISKAGIVRMTESLARVLAPGIRVNGIAPGAVLLPDDWNPEQSSHFVETTPLGKIGDASDAVGALLYLLDASFVTGETIVVDGGRRIRK